MPNFSPFYRLSKLANISLCCLPAAMLSIAIASASFNAQRYVLIVGASFYCLLGIRSLRFMFITSPFGIALFYGVYTIGFLSVWLSPILDWSTADLAIYGLLLGSIVPQAVYYASLSDSQRNRFILLSIFVVCGSASVATLPIALTARITGNTLTWPEPLGGFGNPRFFNQFQTWILPLLSYFVIAPPLTGENRHHRLIRCSAGCLLIGLWILYFRSGGRGTAYALCLGTTLACMIRLPGAAKLGGVSLSAALAAYLLSSAMFPGTEIASRLSSSSLSGRAALWHHAIEMTASHPFFGAGPMMFAAQTGVSAAHPHNLILLWASEYGIPFSLMAFGLLVFALNRWLRFVTRYGRCHDRTVARTYWHTAISIALMAAFAHAMVSGLILMPLSQLAMIFVVGIAVGEFKLSQPKYARILSPLTAGSRVLVSATVVVSALYLNAFIFSGATWEHSASVGNIIGQQFKPRFWLDGQLTLNRDPKRLDVKTRVPPVGK